MIKLETLPLNARVPKIVERNVICQVDAWLKS